MEHSSISAMVQEDMKMLPSTIKILDTTIHYLSGNKKFDFVVCLPNNLPEKPCTGTTVTSREVYTGCTIQTGSTCNRFVYMYIHLYVYSIRGVIDDSVCWQCTSHCVREFRVSLTSA